MPFTHYPKQDANVIFAWVWPRPPDRPNFMNHPRFSKTNRMFEPLAPGAMISGYHSAQNFTRFMGSVACDQSLEVTTSFSNDEVAADGHWVTDESMPLLNYDAEALRQVYDPARQAATGKMMITIFGRWMRVQIKNTGNEPTEFMRVYVRGSVF